MRGQAITLSNVLRGSKAHSMGRMNVWMFYGKDRYFVSVVRKYHRGYQAEVIIVTLSEKSASQAKWFSRDWSDGGWKALVNILGKDPA